MFTVHGIDAQGNDYFLTAEAWDESHKQFQIQAWAAYKRLVQWEEV